MMYAPGADLTRMPFTDTTQRNPMYQGGGSQQNPYANAPVLRAGGQQGGFDPYYGRGSQEAWQAAGSPKSHRPGQAQSIPPQSQGTPYSAYSQPDSNQGLPPSLAAGLVQYGVPQGGAGNYANVPPSQRPTPFSTSIRTWDGQQMDPSQFYGQRDAFIQNINDARSRQSALSGLTNGPPEGRDLQGMWNQAGKMQQNGWQNPFSYDSMMGQQPAGPGGAGFGVAEGGWGNAPILIQGRPDMGSQPSLGGWPDPVNPDLNNPFPRRNQSYGDDFRGVNPDLRNPLPRRNEFHGNDFYGVQGSGGLIPTPPSAPPPPPAAAPTQPPPAPQPPSQPRRPAPPPRPMQTTQDWIAQTQKQNNDPNGQMQQMLRGMTPANKRIYSLMMNDFSQQQRSDSIDRARQPMYDAYRSARP